MKTFVSLLILLAALTACQPTDDEKAAPLLAKIERLNGQGRYQTALDSIRLLRKNFPQALETRKKALILWQEASLKMAQADIAKTDSALQQVLRSLEPNACSARLVADSLRRPLRNGQGDTPPAKIRGGSLYTA